MGAVGTRQGAMELPGTDGVHGPKDEGQEVKVNLGMEGTRAAAPGPGWGLTEGGTLTWLGGHESQAEV